MDDLKVQRKLSLDYQRRRSRTEINLFRSWRSTLLTRREIGSFCSLCVMSEGATLMFLCLCYSDAAVVCGARCVQHGLNWKANWRRRGRDKTWEDLCVLSWWERVFGKYSEVLLCRCVVVASTGSGVHEEAPSVVLWCMYLRHYGWLGGFHIVRLMPSMASFYMYWFAAETKV